MNENELINLRNEQNKLKNIESRFETYLPEFILKSPYLNDIFKNEMLESYYLNKYVQDLLNELSISTAEKSIDKWERLAGLNNENLELSKRINSIINKFSSQIHANYFNFLSMLKTIDNKTELEEFISEYRILIKTFTPMDYANLINFINIIHGYKPAHIGFNIEIYRDIYKNLDTALIFQSTKHTNVIVKPYSDKALISLYKGVVVNKIRKISTNIRTVTGKIQQPFFIGLLINKVKDKKVNIRIYKTNSYKKYFNYLVVNKIKSKKVKFNNNTDKCIKSNFNGVVLNKVKIKEINFKNIDNFRGCNLNGIIINKTIIRRCSIG